MTPEARAQLDADLATLKAFLMPERWTRCYFAVDRYSAAVASVSSYACRWCVNGARVKLADNEQIADSQSLRRLIDQRASDTTDGKLESIGVNDELGYDAVIALLHPVTEEEAAC